MSLIFIAEIIGTIAFSISGTIVAMKKHMDIFGTTTLGITTAVGGGIIRDVLLGIIPPGAFQTPVYAITAVIVSFLVFFSRFDAGHNRTENEILLIMDSIGLSVFTVIGVQTGMSAQGNSFLAVFVGVLTGVGGGVLRDMFSGDPPSIFIRHFYACASLSGAAVTALLWSYGQIPAMTAGTLTVFVLRMIAAKKKWNLPKA